MLVPDLFNKSVMDFVLPNKRNQYLKIFRINSLLVVVGVVILNLFISISFAAIVRNVLKDDPIKNSIDFASVKEEFLVSVVGAPVLETFIYQYLLIEICLYVSKKIAKKENKTFSILVSSCFFSFAHSYNIYYMIATFLGGMSLNALYVYFRIKGKFPFIYVVLAHALYNLAVFGLKRLG